MVLLHVKLQDQSQFLYATTISAKVDDIVPEITRIYESKLRIETCCNDIEKLLLMKDKSLHPVQETMVSLQNCRDSISQDLVKYKKALTLEAIKKTIDSLKFVCANFDSNDSAFTEICTIFANPKSTEYSLWFCGKRLNSDKKIGEYCGSNEKTTMIVKLQSAEEDHPPPPEKKLNKEDECSMMEYFYRRQQEHEKATADEDADIHFYDSEVADNRKLQKDIHRVGDVKWK